MFGDGPGSGEYGHNYTLEVSLRGPIDSSTGMVMDLKRLKEIMEREVGSRFDHRNLNRDTDYFEDRAPTPENLASVIFDLLDAAVPDDLLFRVRLFPTEDLWVEVTR